jgi:predicted small lipoprotein YifL
MKARFNLVLGLVTLASIAGCSKGPTYVHDQSQNSASQESENFGPDSKPQAIVIKAAGDINTAIEQFRDLLGGDLNIHPGAIGGRREVNWDAAPGNLTNNNSFLGNFFGSANPTDADGRKRGLIMTTPGTGFSISDNDFSFIQQRYDDLFNDFSPNKTFIAVGSTITDNFFRVPGTNTDASVQGFGIVFSGVNTASSTSMEFFDGDRFLGSFRVPNNGNNNPGGFSFLGVFFPNDKITRVRVISGSAPCLPLRMISPTVVVKTW